jgi:hypothetical protein
VFLFVISIHPHTAGVQLQRFLVLRVQLKIKFNSHRICTNLNIVQYEEHVSQQNVASHLTISQESHEFSINDTKLRYMTLERTPINWKFTYIIYKISQVFQILKNGGMNWHRIYDRLTGNFIFSL